MSTTARLDIRPHPLGDGARLYEIDCKHGTTTITVLPSRQAGGPVFLDDTMVRAALTKHDLEEGCGCTRRLWQRYGPTGVPA